MLMVVVGCVTGSTACSTHAKRVALPRTLFYEGQLQSCREHLEKLHQSNRHDRDVANLDLAVVDLLQGDSLQAEGRLKDVRDRFDYLEQDSLTEKTVSMWTDDSARSYAGEDYEKILIRVYLALANLMGDGIDAESYTLQIQEKHEQILQREAGSDGDDGVPSQADSDAGVGSPGVLVNAPSIGPGQSAAVLMQPLPHPPRQAGVGSGNTYVGLPIGFYLRGLLREQTHQNYDDALRCYSSAAELLPHCVPLQWDVARARHSVHSQPGCGVVYVFAMVGRGPYKIESIERPTSDVLLIADRIVSAVGPYTVPPTIAPIKVPDVVVPASDIESVGVSLDGRAIGPTESLADIGQLAVSTFQADRKRIIARAVARRIIKKATVAAAKQQMAKDGLTSIGMDLAGIAWEASESADTRCWGLLPRDIQVLRVEAPSGTHSVQLHPVLGNVPVGPARHIDVSVVDGRNTYVLCWFPDADSPGQVLSSDGSRRSDAGSSLVQHRATQGDLVPNRR
jgi:uncharacterized protein